MCVCGEFICKFTATMQSTRSTSPPRISYPCEQQRDTDTYQERLVILVGNGGTIHTLLAILFQLHGKDVLIKKVLKLFVGHVDAELLKAR